MADNRRDFTQSLIHSEFNKTNTMRVEYPIEKALISVTNENPSHAAQVLGDIPEDQ
jgi:hypothetical protein